MHRILYVQVLAAVALGIAVGHVFPTAGIAIKPLGDGFIALIKMMIAPVIFCTLVHGIGAMGDLKKLGRVAWKTLIYFEVVSTLALAIGLLVGQIVQPGAGFNIDQVALDAKVVAGYVSRAHEEGIVKHLLAIVPTSFFGALAAGDLLQVLMIAIVSGIAIARMGELGQKIGGAIDIAGRMFFRIVGMIVRLAPIGAFGAMGFTVGTYGVGVVISRVEGELEGAWFDAAMRGPHRLGANLEPDRGESLQHQPHG